MVEVVKADIRADAVVISLTPKINMPKLTVKLEHVRNIARLIPNAISYVNEGFNPVTFAPEFDYSVKKNVTELLGKLCATFKVSEEKLGSYAIMSAMGSRQLAVSSRLSAVGN